MSTDSDKILTRYTNAETVVTSSAMNKVFGGEFGYNDSVDEFDPLVAGHVHDGLHADGHASKVLLTDGAHVRGYLSGSNLGGTDGTTPAVQYKNIKCYSDAIYGSPAQRRADAAAGGYDLEILAIPEFIEDSDTGERCYYLDLSNSAGGIDGSVQFNEGGAFSGNNDFVYDYSNMSLGIGTEIPTNKLHVIDLLQPPLKIEGITSGTGTPLVVHSDGTIYSDSTIGNQDIFQSVDLSDNSSVGGSGQQVGDSTITADNSTDSLNLVAGDNIIITGDAATDSIMIEADSSNPGGPPLSIQFNDGNPNPAFAGLDSFMFNGMVGGNGFMSGPAMLLNNTNPGPGDYDRFSFIDFAGNNGLTGVFVSGIRAFHHTYGSPGSNVDAGFLSIATNNHLMGPRSAILIDGGQDSQDAIGYVGIGAADPAAPFTAAGFKNPARRLHVMEKVDVLPQGYSPVRINDLYDGPGNIVLWNGPSQTPINGFPHEGDLYKLSPGTTGQVLVVDANGNPNWENQSSSEVKFQHQWDGVSNWVQEVGGPNGYNSSTLSFQQGRGVVTRVLIDSNRTYYLTVPVPLSGELSQGVGSGTPGSHNGLSAYIDPVSGVQDIPSTCRLTAYFVINGGASGSSIANFSATLHYGSDQSQAVSSGQMRDFADGEVIYAGNWNSKHFNSENITRTTNSYPSAQDGMIIVCDFSGLKITTDMLSAGLFSFKLEYATQDGETDYFILGTDTYLNVGLIGSKILWTWESTPAENAAPPPNNAPNTNFDVADSQGPLVDGASVVEGESLTLSAAASVDADGDQLLYSWSYEYASALNVIEELSSDSVKTFNTNGFSGPITFRVQTFDGSEYGDLETFSVAVSAANQAPTAVISGPTTGVEGNLISLSALSSSDPDGDPLTYSWSFNSVPGGSALTNSVASSVGFDFTPDVAGSYVAQLIVNDGLLSSSPETQEIVISAANQAPTAAISGPTTGVEGNLISLDGSSSSDPDGDPLTYSWSFNSVPGGSALGGVTGSSAGFDFTPDVAGSYIAQLIVNDGQLSSGSVTQEVVVSAANQAPTAVISGPTTGVEGNLISLDGSSSSDPDGDPLTYSWSFDSVPGGSALGGVTGSSAGFDFTPDVAGSYGVSLIVNDGQLSSSSAKQEVVVSAANQAPIPKVSASIDIENSSAVPYNSWTLISPNISHSDIVSDPTLVNLTYQGGDIPKTWEVGLFAAKSSDAEDTGGSEDSSDQNVDLSYSWTILESPTSGAYEPLLNIVNPNQNTVGNPYVLYDISGSVLKIKPTDPGHYTVRMEVEDSVGAKSEFLIRFRVSN